MTSVCRHHQRLTCIRQKAPLSVSMQQYAPGARSCRLDIMGSIKICLVSVRPTINREYSKKCFDIIVNS